MKRRQYPFTRSHGVRSSPNAACGEFANELFLENESQYDWEYSDDHVLAGMVCHLGVVVMGWSPDSIIYIILCVYFALHAIIMHSGVLREEKLTREMLRQEYEYYMKRVPRYFFYKK